MRLISYNVNGIRSAIRKGFIDWLKTNPAEVICLQEIKALKENLNLDEIESLGYHSYWYSAQKKGYSGVAILTKKQPDALYYGNGKMQSDAEGRVIRADFGDLTLVNAYFPSGTSGEERQSYKYQWLEEFFEFIDELKKVRPNLLVCGDYNIAHKAIDLHSPSTNKKTSGFLPEERQWMDRFVESGMTDTLRFFNPHPQQYSWWSQRFPTVREQNKGWRLDYFFASESLRPVLRDAAILPAIKHSDHCPVYLEIDF